MIQNLSYITVLEVAQSTTGTNSTNTFLSLLPMVAIFALMYLLMIRPQKKEEKRTQEKINAMRIGDQIVTIGGIVGKIVNISDDEITIASSVANTMMTFKKQAVSTVIQSEENKELAKKEKLEAGEPEKKSFFDKFKKKDKHDDIE